MSWCNLKDSTGNSGCLSLSHVREIRSTCSFDLLLSQISGIGDRKPEQGHQTVRFGEYQPSTQAFSFRLHELAPNFVTSPNGPHSVTSRRFAAS